MHVPLSATLRSTNSHARFARPPCAEEIPERTCAALIAKAASLGLSLPDLSGAVGEIVNLGGNRPLHMRDARERRIYVIAEGWVFRSATTPEGGRQITDILLPGDIIDSTVAGVAPGEYDISACGPATIAAVRNDAFDGQHPVIQQWVDRSRDEEAATLRSRLVSLGRRDARTRLAHLFVELWHRLHRVGLARDGVFRCPMTQEQFADVLGLTPVHINRMFQALRADGLVTFDRPLIVIKDLQRLKTVAGV